MGKRVKPEEIIMKLREVEIIKEKDWISPRRVGRRE